MMLQWMAYAALCAALFGVAAVCAERVFAASGLARRGVWVTTMVLSVVVPAALAVAARSTVASSAGVASAVAESSSLPAAQSHRVDIVVLAAWAAASLLFAVLLVVAHWRTDRALRACRRDTIAERTVFVSREFGPVVVGIFRRRIVVPAWVLALGESEQRFILMHELEHAHSGDPVLALMGVLCVVVMPWNVALWWQLSRLRLAIEVDCDARVVAKKEASVVAYGQLLLCVGERGHAARSPGLALSHSRSSLAKRLDALLERRSRAPAHAAALAPLAICLATSVAFIPAPHLHTMLGELRGVRILQSGATPVAPARVASKQPVSVASAAASATAGLAAPLVRRRTPPSRAVRQSNETVAKLANAALPPVSVVPSNPLGLARVSTPPRIAVGRGGILRASAGSEGGSGGVIRASPSATGVGIGRGGFRSAGSGSSVPDSGGGAVLRAVGRATMVSRPDTTRPPR
ncbi:MAG: M56 family metallopeptidase [bacterium]